VVVRGTPEVVRDRVVEVMIAARENDERALHLVATRVSAADQLRRVAAGTAERQQQNC